MEVDYKWFVYGLYNPIDGRVFYIGKGKGDRPHQHMRDSISGRYQNEAKHKQITAITSRGREVGIFYYAYFNCETSAYNYESDFIRSRLGLTNISANKTKPVVISLSTVLSNINKDIGCIIKHLSDLKKLLLIAVIPDHKLIINTYITFLTNQIDKDKVYG